MLIRFYIRNYTSKRNDNILRYLSNNKVSICLKSSQTPLRCRLRPSPLTHSAPVTSVKSHAAARRRKLRIVRGCGKPRRLLTPLLLLSVKSHAAVRLFACKRAHGRLTFATNFLRYQAVRLSENCGTLNMPIFILLYNA